MLLGRHGREPGKKLVTNKSNSTQKRKNIYREGAKDAKDVKNKGDFALIQDMMIS